jgi:hypothetical protein
MNNLSQWTVEPTPYINLYHIDIIGNFSISCF